MITRLFVGILTPAIRAMLDLLDMRAEMPCVVQQQGTGIRSPSLYGRNRIQPSKFLRLGAVLRAYGSGVNRVRKLQPLILVYRVLDGSGHLFDRRHSVHRSEQTPRVIEIDQRRGLLRINTEALA